MKGAHSVFTLSVISVLWWVAIWFLFEDTITFISGNKRHLRVVICLVIIVSIVIYGILYPAQIQNI